MRKSDVLASDQGNHAFADLLLCTLVLATVVNSFVASRSETALIPYRIRKAIEESGAVYVVQPTFRITSHEQNLSLLDCTLRCVDVRSFRGFDLAQLHRQQQQPRWPSHCHHQITSQGEPGDDRPHQHT